MENYNVKITHKRGKYNDTIISKLKDGEVFYDVTGEHGIFIGQENSSGVVEPICLATPGGSTPTPTGDVLWEKGEGNGSIVQKTIKDVPVEAPCTAKGVGAIATGIDSSANSDFSTAEGMSSMTLDTGVYPGWMDGVAAHAEGNKTTAGGRASHAEGDSTVTNNIGEHAEGRYNVSHFAAAEWGNAGNTIHSVGIGTESSSLLFENSKNAFEIMQNGDAYLYGVGGYDGTNPDAATRLQDAIGGGSGNTGIITVAKDVALVLPEGGTEFTASIPDSDILTTYKANPYNYNLIIEVHGRRDNGELYGYAANHFCYMVNADGQFVAMCNDNIGEGISHDTQFGYNNDGEWFVVYSGWCFTTEGQALPQEGSTVSIYLQKFA